MHKLFSVISLFFLLLVSATVLADHSIPRILIVGDSLSAAYNIPVEQSWPELFSINIRSSYPHASVINASITGETTYGGLQRLQKLLIEYQPTHLIIELGGNDGLRGLNFNQATENLDRMIRQALGQNISVLLIGVRMPPNLGPVYNQRFQQIFESVSRKNGITYLPRFLEGVAAGDASLMQADGIHPTAKAQPLLADRVLARMLAILETP